MENKKNNRIPRTAKHLIVKWLIGTNANVAGQIAQLEKVDGGWHEEINGQGYFVFSSIVRNGNLCEILEVA